MANSRSSAKYRMLFILGCLFLAMVAVCVQAYRLQVDSRDQLREMAARSNTRNYSLGSIRGDIFDRHGEKLATSVAVDSVFIDRRDVKNAGETTFLLSTALNIDYEELSLMMENMGGRSAYVKRHVSEAEAEAVRQMKIKGVGIAKEYKREYPNGTLAAHLLGFVGWDGQGLEGLERALDDKLVAGKTSIRVKRDNRGRIIMDSPDQAISQPRGASVMLTLDLRIQHIAERAIKDAVINYNAVSGMALVVEPRTGDILASASYPTFDPNNFADSEPEERRNRILTDPFEPGSTMKIFTVAAALQEERITPDSVFFCENGQYLIDGKWPIRDTGIYGDLSVKEVIQKSSNICALKIGERLGPAKLHHYLEKFGFGQRTGLNYPQVESAGRLRPYKSWHIVDSGSISFGQGLSITALQLAMATSALAYDGSLMRPNIVSRIIDAEGNVIESRPEKIVRQVVTPLVAQQVLAMMRMVVMKNGTGRRGEVSEYPVAAKTGTAQKVVSGQKSYSADKYVASFVGVAPYDNPRLTVLVVLDEPKPSYHGGVVAAPVFKEIMSQALPLLDVPPRSGGDELQPMWPTPQRSKPGAPGVLMADGGSYNYVRKDISGSKGDGPIPEIGKAPERKLDFDELAQSQEVALSLETDEERAWASKMPDVSGLTMREALDLLSRYELALEYEGSGVAFQQEPAKGAMVAKGDSARIRFMAVSP
ncbi:MAG: transpeptidase family protein [Deltaproteobacteria bacterium]|jgi:cell division protein FtsI (penicillin-binding protein 3)|nr:transpeptidase family protein [Deltaproteobacteria bacterium]